MSTANSSQAVRVLHFVTGGLGSGAAQVAITLVKSALGGPVSPLLVLRRKSSTDPAKLEELKAAGVPFEIVANFPHWLTVWQLFRICRRFKPDVLVAHGYREHIWGRYAGLLAGVPKLVHVEHNREKYSWWRLLQARWLARRTARIVGVSDGVRNRLLELGFPEDRTVSILNGIRLAPFAEADKIEFASRKSGIVMCARFARQKDHSTLIKAVGLLRDRGLTPPLLLAGGGKSRYRKSAQQLAQRLNLGDQVQFLGHYGNVPELLMQHQICVLSTHYEGMGLALVEGMAAGCAVVGTAVLGVREWFVDRNDGRLVPENDPVALADVLEQFLRNPEVAARLAATARQAAIERHGLELMNQRYEALFLQLAAETAQASS